MRDCNVWKVWAVSTRERIHPRCITFQIEYTLNNVYKMTDWYYLYMKPEYHFFRFFEKIFRLLLLVDT